MRLIGSVEVVATEESGEYVEDIKASVPTTGQVMDAVDLLLMLARITRILKTHSDVLQAYEKSMRPLLARRTQEKVANFGKE